MKIYVIGLPASGKTTTSKKLAKKYNTKAYELDCLVYDDEHDHIRRSNEEIEKLFEQILKNKSWVIEDVGREIFEKGLQECDYIYYLKISKAIIYGRVIKRWIRQRLGKEEYNYPPNLFQFFDTFKTVNRYLKKQPKIIERIEKYHEKVTYLSNKDLKKL